MRNAEFISTAALSYGGGHAERQLPAAVQAQLKVWREQACCAGCQQRIGMHLTPAVRGIGVFHPSCAHRHDERTQQRSAATATSTSIGRIRGRACPLGEWCTIRHRDGYDIFERFERSCFDASLQRGGQTLQTNHDGVSIPGRLQFGYDGVGLTFTFDPFDSPRGRDVLRRMRAGECKGCSVGFGGTYHARTDPFTGGEIIETAALSEVSLIFGDRRPAWFLTFAEAID